MSVDYEDYERRNAGRFFTLQNPFNHKQFHSWAFLAGLDRDNLAVLEPFAGAGDIIRHLKSMYPKVPYRMFDIEPRGDEVVERDTFKDFPTGHKVCITNPPWLGKSNAQRKEMRESASLDDDYDNLYAKGLALALTHCEWVACLVPGSFLISRIFRERLSAYIEVTNKPFVDLDPPVGLALFTPYRPAACEIYRGDEYLGWLEDIEKHYPVPPIGAPMTPSIEHFSPDKDEKALQVRGRQGFRFGHDPDDPARACFFDEWVEGTPKPRGVFTDPGVRIDIEACNQHLTEFILKTKDMLRYQGQGRTPEGYHRRYITNHLANAIARCHATSNQSVLF